MKVGLDGVEFLGASASEWINGGIRILPGDKGEMKASYPLYANLEKALENSLSDYHHNREFECRDAAGCAGR